MRDFQLPGRSPIRATEGAAATSHPLATLAAIETLRSGGNAVDAAVAAAAVLAVVEPQSTGIGGDGFMLYAPGSGSKVIAFNGSGHSPQAATVDWYRERGFEEIPLFGAHSVSVPGLVDAWARIVKDHGTRGLDELLQPAIRYAEEGFVVYDRVAFDWELTAERLAQDPNAARILLPQGRSPRAGERFRQPELAATLKIIAAKGRDGFYLGPVAEDMVGYLRSLGGLHTLEDFASVSGSYVEPVRGRYRGVDVYQMPPNNQGLTALLMLHILSGFDFSELAPFGAERFHLMIEAGRLVDRDRNAVSLINSVYFSFGSGLVAPKSGVWLQNRGASFRLDPKHPNAIAPRKRPMHTIMPGMATRDGRAMMPYGVMGGDFQPFGHVHLLTNMLDFGMDPQAALDGPRVFPSQGMVEVEPGVDARTVKGLEA